jgi:hypothetical protein
MRMSLVASLLLAWSSLAFADKPADWAVEGQWLDTCNCANPCPCWKSEKPTLKNCQDLYYFHVDKGHVGAVKLDGVDVIGVALSPDDKVIDKAVADKDIVFANIYISKTLPAATAAAVEKLFTTDMAIVPPESAKNHALKKVAMKATLDDAGARVSIPKVLELDVKKTKKPYAQDTKVIPWSSASVDGVQTRFDFSDDGRSWKLKQRNASFASFSWSSQKAEAAAKAAAAAAAQPKK